MYYKSMILGLTILSLTQCASQKKVKTSEPEMTVNETKQNSQKQNLIYFSEGENRFLPEYQMNVTFKNIAEDSRCPQGTQCVWAGVAVANIELMSTTSRPMTLQFSSTNVSGKNYQKTQTFNGYEISLEEVNPYPTTENGQKKLAGKYKIGISFKKTD